MEDWKKYAHMLNVKGENTLCTYRPFPVAPQDVPVVPDNVLDLVLSPPLDLLVHREDPDRPAEEHRLRLGALLGPFACDVRKGCFEEEGTP